MRKGTITCHPSYDIAYPIWDQLYVTCELGEEGVKKAGERFLPKTEGQIEDDDDGTIRYKAYKNRATYYNFCQSTIKKAMGLLHSKEATLVASEKLKKWVKTLTIDGESLDSLSRDISSAQLLLGRLGLLLDYPTTGAKEPYVTKYSADSMLVWEEILDGKEKKLKFVLLDETSQVFNRDTKQFEEKEKYRLLALDKSGKYYTVVLDQKEWSSWDIDNPSKKATYPKMPTKTLDFIPFVPVNIKTTTMSIDKPLLVELSNLSLSAYRADADYRQGLYHQAFALLYILGISEEKLRKKGVRSDGFVASENEKAKIGYASADADGLSEMRQSVDDLKVESEGNGIVISDKEGVESGKALKTRIMLQTSDLNEIALTAGEAITKLLKMAQMCIKDTDEFEYKPNTDFDQEKATTREYLDFWNVCISGGTNLKNIYNWAVKNDLAYETTYEEWLENNQETMEILGYTAQTADSNIAEGEDDDDTESNEAV